MNLKPIHAALFVAAVLPLHAATDLTNALNTYSGNSQENGNGAAQPIFLTGDPLADPVIPASGLEASFLAASSAPAAAFETIFFNPTGAIDPAFPGATFGANRTNDNNGRNYLRTVETGYYTQDFTADVTVRRQATTLLAPAPSQAGTNSRRSVFFGLGTGALNSGGANPDAGTANAAAYFEMQNGFSNVSRRAQGQSTNLANRELGFSAMTTVQSDSIRMRMSYNSVTRVLTLAVDYDHVPGQPFVADQTFPAIDLKLVKTTNPAYNLNTIVDEWITGDRTSIFFGGDRGVVFTDLVIDVTQPAAPPPPTGLAVASVGDQVVNLAWSSFAIPGTTFKVYRSTIPNDPAATAIATGLTATSFTDDALTNPGNTPVNGTTYYYTVTQSNTVAQTTESAKSNEIPATPVAGAVAPEGLVARNAGDNIIILDWNDLIAPFDTYTVYRAVDVGGSPGTFAAIANNLTTSSYVDEGVVTGTTYHYYITSTIGIEESDPSATRSATPKALEIFVDFNAAVVNSGRGVLAAGPGATWNNDTGDSASADKLNDSTGVATTVGLDGASNFGPFALGTGSGVGGNPATLGDNFDLMQDYRFTNATARTYTFSGLAPARSYDLYLFGYGGDDSQNSAYNVGGVIKQNRTPFGLTTTTENRHYLTFTFVSENDGTFAFEWGTPGILSLTDAQPGGGAGFSGFQLVENATALLQPTGLAATSNNTSAVDLTWDGVLGADSFEIFRSTTSSADYVQIGTSATTAYSDTDAALTPGTTYYYVVKAAAGLKKSFTSAEASGVKAPIIVDTDLDGLSDADEALIGTDPNDAGDFFRAKTSTVTPNGATNDINILISGAPGTYVIERSTTLLEASWTEIPSSSQIFTWNTGTVLENPLNLSATGLTPAPGGREFFRAKGVAPLPAN